MPFDLDIPEGFCQCGCGERTRRSEANRSRPGYERSQFRRFVNGHSYAKALPYRIDSDTGCWVWQRALSGPAHSRYGVLKRNGKRIKAHRFYFEKFKGQIPDGLYMDHLCGNKLCVNPDHLEAVTPAVNVQRSKRAKLNWDNVREIRRLANDFTRKELAARFGVAAPVISNIVLGKAWRG
jgi:hypothetical protein